MPMQFNSAVRMIDPTKNTSKSPTTSENPSTVGLPREVSPAAQSLVRHPVDDLPPDPNRDLVPRRLYLKQSDFMAHGTSDRCPGCRALISGGRAQSRTEECRIRVEGEIRKTEEGKVRLRAAASRVGDGLTGRALKRVRSAETIPRHQRTRQRQHHQVLLPMQLRPE